MNELSGRQARLPEYLARFGYAARGVVYTVVGGLAVLAALGRGGRAPDSQSALAVVLSQPFGAALLALVALGLACFALWRIAQAALDADHLGTEPKALVRRAAFAVSALVNAALALTAAELVLRTSTSRGGDGAARDWTALLLSLPLGSVLVGLVGLVVVGAGLATGWKGYQGRVTAHVSADPGTRAWLVPLGRAGYLARGLVFTLIGAFLISAAYQASAREARGLAGTLRALQEQPYGWALLLVTALGLFAFGAFQLALARYRRIDAPKVARAGARGVEQIQTLLR